MGSKSSESIAASVLSPASVFFTQEKEKTEQKKIEAQSQEAARKEEAAVREQQASQEAAQQESSRQIAAAVAQQGNVKKERGKFGIDEDDELAVRQSVLGRG